MHKKHKKNKNAIDRHQEEGKFIATLTLYVDFGDF